jgi:hypothetical protein
MEAGFQPMSAQQALQLAGLGVVGQVGGNLNPGNMQGELAKIAPDLTLTQDIQGKAGGAGGAGSLTQAQLLSAAFVGDQSSQRAAQVAQETRGAKFAGGGGPVAGNSQGGQGAGSATQ